MNYKCKIFHIPSFHNTNIDATRAKNKIKSNN